MADVLHAHDRECAVCTNDLVTPKILSCGHLLCRECVIFMLDAEPNARCPLCRGSIIIGKGNTGSAADVADTLPTDFMTKALVESARVLDNDPVCCACDDVKADFICMQCLDMLCCSCAKKHNRFTATRSHDVESLSNVTAERLAASSPALCADHGEKQAEFFCFDHFLAVCKACKTTKHNECSEVKDLEDETKSAENALNDLTQVLEQAEKTLEQAIGQVNSHLQDVDVSEQKEIAHEEQACERLQKLAEEYFRNMKEETRASHLKKRDSLLEMKTALCKRQAKVTSHKIILRRATTVASPAALINARKDLTKRVDSLHLSVDLEAVWVKPLLSATWCEEAVGRMEKELLMLQQRKPRCEKQRLVLQVSSATSTADNWLSFHDDKWSNESQLWQGLYATSQPMEPNILYQVIIEGTDWKGKDFLWGVLSKGPPVTKRDMKCSRYGHLSKEDLVVSLTVDSFHNLHFLIDGREIGLITVTEGVPRPCYAFFALSEHSNLKITSFPKLKLK